MKTFALRLFPITLLLALTLPAEAQNSFGIRLGYSPASTLHNNHVIINGGNTDLIFNTQKANNSIYTGAYLRRDLDYGFFLQGEALYAYQSNDYLISYLDNDAQANEIHEVSHRLALPASVGIQLGSVEILSGLNANILLARKTDLSEFAAFSEDIPAVTFGWHSGIGMSVQQLKFELRYHMDFSNYGADMYLYDQHLRLSNAGNRLVFGVSYGF